MDMFDDNTPEKGRLKLDEHLVYLTTGAISALTDVLDDLQKSKVTAAGIGLATAVVEKHLACQHQIQAMKALRLAAQAGADLHATDVATTLEGNDVYLSWDLPGEGSR